MTNDLEQKEQEICPQNGDPEERYLVDIGFCKRKVLLAAPEKHIQILVVDGFIHLYVNDEMPMVMEQGDVVVASGYILAHGLRRGVRSIVCYKHLD